MCETRGGTISYRDNLAAGDRVSSSVKCIRRSVAVKRTGTCELCAFPPLSRTLVCAHFTATLARLRFTELLPPRYEGSGVSRASERCSDCSGHLNDPCQLDLSFIHKSHCFSPSLRGASSKPSQSVSKVRYPSQSAKCPGDGSPRRPRYPPSRPIKVTVSPRSSGTLSPFFLRNSVAFRSPIS